MDRLSRVIFEYAARIGGESDPDSLLVLNAGLARDLVAADRCSIRLSDERTGEFRSKVAHGVQEIRIRAGQRLVGACFQANEPILVNAAASDPGFMDWVDKKSGHVTHSVLVLPLHGAGGRVTGALQALNKPGGFSPDDVDLLGLATAYSASTIETQRLRQKADAAKMVYRELEIASDVQRRLLPQTVPAIARLDCAAFCRPAKFVGGDYYDFITLPEGPLAFTLGDVSLQSSLRTQLVRAPQSLAGLMNDFNRSVCGSSLPDRYTALFFGLLDLAARRLV